MWPIIADDEEWSEGWNSILSWMRWHHLRRGDSFTASVVVSTRLRTANALNNKHHFVE
jgi:hypothetical protein